MAVPAGKASHMIVAVIATITFLTASTVLGATPIIISASELKAAYEANRREANRTYKGEPLVVFGYLAEVDGKTVRFRSDITCRMESRRAAREMRQVGPSRYIVMAGTGDGHKSREPKVDDCKHLRSGDEHYVSVRGDVGAVPARVRQPTRETRQAVLMERPDESCRVIMARRQDALTALRLFCGPFDPGLFEGAGADGLLLTLWVSEAHARALLSDRMEAREIMTDRVNLWGTVIQEDFPAIRVFRGSNLLLTARGTRNGVKVNFEVQ